MPYQLYCRNCKTTAAPVMPSGQRCNGCGHFLALALGETISGVLDTYTIDSIIGMGGMGIVYKTISAARQEVVVKELYVDPSGYPQGTTDPQYLADLNVAQMRFRREAFIQAAVHHRAFPTGFGYFTDPALDNREFMAMQFIQGSNLEEVLARNPGGIGANEVLDIGLKICDGLEVMHFNTDPTTGQLDALIHRDIKPANLILTPNGDMVILDLGIARSVQQSVGTKGRKTQAGTPEYAMPEVILGNPVERSDIGALAATLYHLYTGRTFPPMDWDAWQTMVDNDLPASWQPIFRKAIDKDEGQRQRDIREFRAELISLLPPHLRPVQAQAVQPAAPLAAGNVSIRWIGSGSSMVNPNQYRAVLSGQVIQNNSGLPHVLVIPFIVDTGAGAWNGTRVQTNQQGDFSLVQADITVPATVRERSVEIVIEDPTGIELHRETVRIARPGNWRAVRAAAGLANVGGAIGGGIAAPFRGAAWAGRGIARGVARAGHGIAHQAVRPFQWIKNNPPSAPTIAALLMILCAALFVVGIVWRWPILWVPCPVLAGVLWLVRCEKRKGKPFYFRRIAMSFASTLWLLIGFLFALADK